MAIGAVAVRSVIDEVLVAAEAEGAGARDLADAGWRRLVAARSAASEVCVACMGHGRGLIVALNAAHGRLVMSGVAAGAVGLCGTEREAAGVTGRALNEFVSRVVEG
jgi:hypothetical protein